MPHAIIAGKSYTDQRGSLIAFNEFDMTRVRRTYLITPADLTTLRGWQGHRYEQKWFLCLHGAFRIGLVSPLNLDATTGNEQVSFIDLDSTIPQILHITGGYFTAIKARLPQSLLQVFSDSTVADSVADDYRRPADFWTFD